MSEYADGFIDSLGTNIELIDSQARASITQINNSLTQLDFCKKAIEYIKITSTASKTVAFSNQFFTFILMGFAQGIGAVALAGKAESNSVSVTNMLTGSAFSSTYLTFSASGSNLTISTSLANASEFTLIKGNVRV